MQCFCCFLRINTEEVKLEQDFYRGINHSVAEREMKVQTQSSNPVYRQTEVSFKQLTDSNQSSVDDMATIRDSRAMPG